MSYGLEELKRTLAHRERDLEHTYERMLRQLKELDEVKEKADRLRVQVRELKNDIRFLEENAPTT